MSGRLSGRAALVIGAGSSALGMSNGQAAAVLYAREGARVVAFDRAEDAVIPTRDAIRSEGGTVEVVIGDIACPEDVSRAVALSIERFGTVDILHNNVGICLSGGATEVSLEDWRRSLDVNLTGAFLACRAVLPMMAAKGKGAIVNISTIAAIRIGSIRYVAYTASKAGLTQMTKALAVEYADRGVRINNVLPGAIDAAAAKVEWERFAERFADGDVAALARSRVEGTPMHRLGSPWDVAHAALFLVSDEASFITGVDLPVDGGLSCR